MSEYEENEAAEGEDEGYERPRVLLEVGRWAVSHRSVMMGRHPGFTYEIHKTRLGESDWCAHIFEKTDGTFLEFVEAFYQGRRIHRFGTTSRDTVLMIPDPVEWHRLEREAVLERRERTGRQWESRTAAEVMDMSEDSRNIMWQARRMPISLDSESARLLEERCLQGL